MLSEHLEELRRSISVEGGYGAMGGSSGGHLPGRASREFAKTFLWMLAILGPLSAVVFVAAGVPLVKMLVFVGILVCIVAAIITVLGL